MSRLCERKHLQTCGRLRDECTRAIQKTCLAAALQYWLQLREGALEGHAPLSEIDLLPVLSHARMQGVVLSLEDHTCACGLGPRRSRASYRQALDSILLFFRPIVWFPAPSKATARQTDDNKRVRNCPASSRAQPSMPGPWARRIVRPMSSL